MITRLSNPRVPTLLGSIFKQGSLCFNLRSARVSIHFATHIPWKPKAVQSFNMSGTLQSDSMPSCSRHHAQMGQPLQGIQLQVWKCKEKLKAIETLKAQNHPKAIKKTKPFTAFTHRLIQPLRLEQAASEGICRLLFRREFRPGTNLLTFKTPWGTVRLSWISWGWLRCTRRQNAKKMQKHAKPHHGRSPFSIFRRASGILGHVQKPRCSGHVSLSPESRTHGGDSNAPTRYKWYYSNSSAQRIET